ncbi:hypothetical protein PsorP6_001788 [Peronosclerospora sorghi]|uniref:Uncharacterized protein n=1 Tax=Peronosclerospora sorghi TaxID=230839 RepID=A0ACC0WXN1_9STRA|nr:hypothetical protein PsorP6_001788 [Peronosclerospora sorghi]
MFVLVFVDATEHRMGNATSTSVGDGDEHTVESGACCGFRVLGIQEQSPASAVGFVSFFDFVLEANGIRLDTRDATLMELIAQSEDRPMQLRVWNVKSQTTRELQLTPSRKWPGKGLLGVTIRFDSYEGAEDQLIHVLNVAKASPAERAGLRAGSDYLLGTPERAFTDAEDLHNAILDALDGSFQCYVYNSLDDQVRIVSIVPSDRWGGDGVLGAEVGHGYLHRLPSMCRKTVGSSVGFAKLPKDAKAATDAFCMSNFFSGSKIETNAAFSVRPLRRDDDSRDSSEKVEGRGIKIADSNMREETRRTTSSPREENQQATTKDFSEEGDAGSHSVKHSEIETVLSVKPRYTSRMDPKFPISTVTVIAEP